jgi:hypothetical protein
VGKPLPFGEIKFASLQFLGTPPEMVFSALAVLDVDTRSKPLHYVPVFVMKRYLPVQKRPICPVRAPNARFGFEWFPTRQSGVPFLNYSSNIFRMNGFSPTPTTDVLYGLAQEIQPAAVEVIQIAIGPSGVNKRGSRIDRASKRVFGRSRLVVLKGLTRLHTGLLIVA